MRLFHHPTDSSYISLNTQPAFTMNNAIVDSSTGLQPGSLENRNATTTIPTSWQDGGQTSAEKKGGEWAALLRAGFTHLTTDADQKLL